MEVKDRVEVKDIVVMTVGVAGTLLLMNRVDQEDSIRESPTMDLAIVKITLNHEEEGVDTSWQVDTTVDVVISPPEGGGVSILVATLRPLSSRVMLLPDVPSIGGPYMHPGHK